MIKMMLIVNTSETNVLIIIRNYISGCEKYCIHSISHYCELICVTDKTYNTS